MTCDTCRLCLETPVADVLNQHTAAPTLCLPLRPIGGGLATELADQTGAPPPPDRPPYVGPGQARTVPVAR